MKTIKDVHSGLSAKVLRILVLYDPATGAMYWRERASGRRMGIPAGWIDAKTGRRRIQLPVYGSFLTARLAVLYMTGRWPKGLVDHRNENKGDDSWDNLKDTNNSRNQLNRRKPRSCNTSGVTGVSVNGKGWEAALSIDGRSVLRKVFRRKKDAIAARREAEQKYLVGIKHSL